jgi:hypothetical protein
MAPFAPMPSASVSTATAVNTGLFRSTRSAKRVSWPSDSISGKPRTSRYASFVRTTPPKSRSAAFLASSGDSPRAM